VKLEHLYIHVPFCLRRCSYCDFAVSATREPPIDAWLDAVLAEFSRARSEGWGDGAGLKTLYIGGGTPSLLGPGGMEALGRRLADQIGFAPDMEWTAEANPESFTSALAEEWRAAGVSRLSLGVQTFHAGTLRWMGRMHGPEGPGKAVRAAREAGFDDFSVDLIFGLPARLERDWAADLERALELEPTHVSLYGLTAEPATPLGRWVAEGREALAPEETYEAEYLFAVERMSAAGFEPYEVSNFAKPGRESRHNAAYWNGNAYLGLGPGAHSYSPPRRYWNVRDWDEYRTRLAAGASPLDAEETVDAAGAALERVWLGLRTRVGLAGLSNRQEALARDWENAGLARLARGRVTLTARGWLLLDRLAVDMDALAQTQAPGPESALAPIAGGTPGWSRDS
jgi:oxygen-independent coproporphyrinogen-3 oxidase